MRGIERQRRISRFRIHSKCWNRTEGSFVDHPLLEDRLHPLCRSPDAAPHALGTVEVPATASALSGLRWRSYCDVARLFFILIPRKSQVQLRVHRALARSAGLPIGPTATLGVGRFQQPFVLCPQEPPARRARVRLPVTVSNSRRLRRSRIRGACLSVIPRSPWSHSRPSPVSPSGSRTWSP